MILVSQGPESTPKSILARLLAFIWIFIAVILVGIMTSIITAAMVREYPTPYMEGKTIVTLSQRPYNELIILKNYGKPHFVSKNDTFSEIGQVLELGLSESYGGALIDKFVLKTYLSDLRKTQPVSYEAFTTKLYLTSVSGKDDAH